MTRPPVRWRIRDRLFDTGGSTLVVGILNVTPDSFSDGGRFADPEAAVAHGLAMAGHGADLVDVGGESTRPGSARVEASEELRRVVPVVQALAASGVAVSIDTMKPAVAAAAIEAGASVINDVTALADPGMRRIAADAGVGVVLMHMAGTPETMQADPHYEDVVEEVAAFLGERAAGAVASGVDPETICIDPGIGFGKDLGHNLSLLAGVPRLASLGYPVMVGASRKRFLTGILGDLPAEERDVPTAAAHVLAIAGGAAMIRVHDVVTGLRTARVADAIVGAGRR
jgi:dihydropteroate synthase